MTTVQLPRVDQAPIPAAGLTPEVLTVSGLLSMPAVWTAVVERALPANVLLERFLVVLLACTLIAELVRRLGEGGALGHATAGDVSIPAQRTSSYAGSAGPLDAGVGAAALAPAVAAEIGSPLDGALEGPLDRPLGSPLGGTDDLAGFGSFDDLGDLGDLGDLTADLAPLDLDADPF